MASDILHIKDSYYFEIPKVLLPATFKSKAEYPEHLNVWVRLDPQFQEWEFHRNYHDLEELAKSSKLELPPEGELHHAWHDWVHGDHVHHGKPFRVYVDEHLDALNAGYQAWLGVRDEQGQLVNAGKSIDEYIAAEHPAQATIAWAWPLRGDLASQWATIKDHGRNDEAVAEFKQDDSEAYQWNQEKIDWYNHHLSGKILIPQPWGELRNLYQAEPGGFAISKFMLVELAVALIMLVAFSWVAKKLSSGTPPKGRLLNLLEVFLVFIRDQIAKPAIGGEHHDEHHDHEHHGHHDGHGHDSHGHDAHRHAPQPAHARAAKKEPISDEKLFAPVLWTIFFFVLGCNLFGIAPWAGSPTASFNVTLALAGVTFLAVFLGSCRKFGFIGFFLNQVPTMDLPLAIAIVLKPMIFVIELGGLMIKHGVLAIRLLANMVAGHLVILGIMGLAFGVGAALTFTAPDMPGWLWPMVASIAVVGSTLFTVLELFVAFLQAYIFTFLSALFIGAAVHKH